MMFFVQKYFKLVAELLDFARFGVRQTLLNPGPAVPIQRFSVEIDVFIGIPRQNQ